jgi:hypothetical protein
MDLSQKMAFSGRKTAFFEDSGPNLSNHSRIIQGAKIGGR